MLFNCSHPDIKKLSVKILTQKTQNGYIDLNGQVMNV